jgi:hypothetical protein
MPVTILYCDFPHPSGHSWLYLPCSPLEFFHHLLLSSLVKFMILLALPAFISLHYGCWLSFTKKAVLWWRTTPEVWKPSEGATNSQAGGVCVYAEGSPLRSRWEGRIMFARTFFGGNTCNRKLSRREESQDHMENTWWVSKPHLCPELVTLPKVRDPRGAFAAAEEGDPLSWNTYEIT